MINIRLSNQDFGLKNEGFTDNCRIRYSSRGIIYNPKTDKIAIIAKTRLKECKLPGGGKEGNETDEESFQREVLEETGCKVKIIQKLGRHGRASSPSCLFSFPENDCRKNVGCCKEEI